MPAYRGFLVRELVATESDHDESWGQYRFMEGL